MTFETINCTSGRLFPDVVLLTESLKKTMWNYGVVFSVITILYVFLCVLCKRSFGQVIIESVNKNVKTFCSNITDIAVVLWLTIVVERITKQIIYVEFYDLFFLLLGFYTVVVIFFQGKSIGNIAFCIQFEHKTRFCIAERLLCKYFIIILFPYVLCKVIGVVEPVSITWNIIFFATLLIVVSFVLNKDILWSKWSKARKIYQTKGNGIYVLLLLVFQIVSLYIMNNSTQPDSNRFLGMKFPVEFKKYPDNDNVKPYYEYVKTQTKSPKEYILGLFEKYDIVVLEESFHGECTEWDLITDIVTDSVFVKKIGNVFSEYGSAIHQDKIDAFLRTNYADEERLEKATASLMSYMSGGFYNYVKSVNIKNTHLPESEKLRHYYCDNIDWDYFTKRDGDGIDTLDRDKFMAQVVINWYNEQVKNGERHKCLVVTNTRHSFGYADEIEKVKNGISFIHQTEGNQCMYLYEALPGKVANVIQNTPKMQNYHFLVSLYRPINYGIWDKAFEKNNYNPVGFDLKDTPFGNDIFDAYCLRGAKSDFVYSDIYTGVVFNKPFLEMREYHHPYHRYAIEHEAKLKGIANLCESIFFYDEIDDNASYDDNMNWACRWISMANAIPLYVNLFLLLLSAFVIALIELFDW